MPNQKRPRSAASAGPTARRRAAKPAGARKARADLPDAKAMAEKHAAAQAFAIEAARSLSDDKNNDIIVLDVRGRSPVADFLVIGTGTSERQMRSSAYRVADLGGQSGFALFRSNKDDTNQTWFVLDFVDVVVHVFDPAARAYYDLEMMWGDSPRVAWERPAPARRPAATKTPKPTKRAATAAKPRAPRRKRST